MLTKPSLFGFDQYIATMSDLNQHKWNEFTHWWRLTGKRRVPRLSLGDRRLRPRYPTGVFSLNSTSQGLVFSSYSTTVPQQSHFAFFPMACQGVYLSTVTTKHLRYSSYKLSFAHQPLFDLSSEVISTNEIQTQLGTLATTRKEAWTLTLETPSLSGTLY